MRFTHSEKAPTVTGPYSQAIEANGFVSVSGQLLIGPSTGRFLEGGTKEQAQQSIFNAQEVLKVVGLDLFKVIKTTVYLSNMANLGVTNEACAQLLTEPYPAHSAVAVRTLPKEALVEVGCVAVRGQKPLLQPLPERKGSDRFSH